MPSLNNRQFDQGEFPGFHTPEVTPHGFGRRQHVPEPPPADPNDPAQTYKRGTVGEGQTMLNFDAPDAPLETAQAGLIPVDSSNDPTWDRSAWLFGGANRSMTQTMREHGDDPVTDIETRADTVTRGWRNAPVETIGPDAEIRTNQGRAPIDIGDSGIRVGGEVGDIEEGHVEILRGEGNLAFQDPETGEEEFPWVAEVEGKRYLLEGHHRAISARTRDSGEFPAHVLRGGNWGQIEEQLYDGPWTR